MAGTKGKGKGTDKKFGRRYPWEKWFAQKSFTLVKGKHYHDRTYTMAQQVRNAAGRPRHRVRVSIEVAPDDSKIKVKVLGPADDAEVEGGKA